MSARDYVTVREIARGGMASVSLGVRSKGDFRRVYALKRVLPAFASDEEFIRGFEDEALLAGGLRHANVVSVLDVGTDADGPYLVMDYVEGVTLADVLSASSIPHPLPLGFCLNVCRQVADGLHHAHELRASDGTPMLLVHRDVSPSNILLGFDGVVRVTDFGIAKA
ncbi:MAG: serine/threonine protein kinase, partial [Myxococcales bacterium]|nr:serine/threonine protein kinase [Myxococcales bacterium]